MVLFLCAAVLGLLAAGCLTRIRVLFHAEVLEVTMRMHAELRLLFGMIRIPMRAETGLTVIPDRAERGRKKKRKRPQRKRLMRLLLSKGRKNDAMRLVSFSCKGLIGNEQDAFFSVMGAGGVQVFLEMLLRFLFPACRDAYIRITPSFERSSIWVYMEGILDILPLQIISAMMKEKRRKTHNASH